MRGTQRESTSCCFRIVIKLCEAKVPVDLISLVPVKRSHSVCAQGGINASVNTKGEGDSPQVHLEETVYGGDFLANQPPAKAMCEMAPSIIFLFDRMGVPFSRTKEGFLDFRRFGGTKHHRTAFAGASTGQQLLYALDEQVRRFESSGKVRKFEHWEMLSLVLDDHQVCRGLVAMDLQTLELLSFPSDRIRVVLRKTSTKVGMKPREVEGALGEVRTHPVSTDFQLNEVHDQPMTLISGWAAETVLLDADAERVADALASLPSDYREVLVLRICAGLPQAVAGLDDDGAARSASERAAR